MNPESLMLGNYILFNNKEIIVTPEIFKILGNSCKRKLFSPIEISSCEILKFEPNAFVCYSDYKSNPNVLFRIVKIQENFYYDSVFQIIKIKFIHELQNIHFLLTGEKLLK